MVGSSLSVQSLSPHFNFRVAIFRCGGDLAVSLGCVCFSLEPWRRYRKLVCLQNFIGIQVWRGEWFSSICLQSRLEQIAFIFYVGHFRSQGSEHHLLGIRSDFVKCSAELNRPENAGLGKAISFLENIKQSTNEAAVTKGGPISWADLIHIAGMFCRKPVALYPRCAKLENGKKFLN